MTGTHHTKPTENNPKPQHTPRHHDHLALLTAPEHAAATAALTDVHDEGIAA